MRIAITGATGFVGAHLVHALHTQGHHLQLLIRPGKRSPLLADERIEEVFGTLEQHESLHKLVSGCDAVVHCAASVRGANWQHFYQPNVLGTQNLLAALQASDARRFLLISSLAAREPQLSWYAESKHLAEQSALRIAGERCAILRPPAIYGPGDREMLPLLKMLCRGWAVRITPPTQRLSLIHVSDLTDCICALLASSAVGTFELNDGEPDDYDWAKLCAIAKNFSGNTVRTLPLPPDMLKALAWSSLRLARWRGSKPILTPGKARELLWPDWRADGRMLSKATDWRPTIRLPEGLQTLAL